MLETREKRQLMVGLDGKKFSIASSTIVNQEWVSEWVNEWMSLSWRNAIEIVAMLDFENQILYWIKLFDPLRFQFQDKFFCQFQCSDDGSCFIFFLLLWEWEESLLLPTTILFISRESLIFPTPFISDEQQSTNVH